MEGRKVYRIACIGAGSISREFSLRYLNSSPYLEVCAVVDLDITAAQSLALDVAYRRAGATVMGEKYRETVDKDSISDDAKLSLPAVVAATSIDEILSTIDCVYIGTPPLSHAQLTIKALSAQKHVILEKPLAVSMEDCDAIVQAADEAYRTNGLIVNVNIGMRHNKALHELRERVTSPEFGRISRIALKNHYMQWPRVWQIQPWVAQRAQVIS
jgi:predicted dehydrogenase